jgi:hypothetical protein
MFLNGQKTHTLKVFASVMPSEQFGTRRRADQCTGHNYRTIHCFIAQERLSHCDRGHYFYRDGVGFKVHCFAEREHAERFQKRFSGEFMDPKDRPRWPSGR